MLPRELKQYSNRKIFISLGAITGVAAVATAASLITLSVITNVRRTAQQNTSAHAQLQVLQTDLRTAESNLRGYLISAAPTYLADYQQTNAIVRQNATELQTLTRGAAYVAQVDRLVSLINTKLAALDALMLTRQTSNDAAAFTADLDKGKDLMDQIDAQAGGIEASQGQQLGQDRTTVQTLSDIARDISVLTLMLTLALALSVYYLYLKAIQSERELDRAKDEFVSLASHQLRTPATGIKSILSTLVAGDFGPLNERQAYFMQRALESNERELSIIEELLNVAKADAGRLILHSSSFEVGKLINLIADEQRGSIEEKHQQLSIKLPRRGTGIYGDEEKLYMAIGNLLDNARKYTPEFGRIQVAVIKRYGEFHIEVADNGIGIDSDELAHIFDRFQRASQVMQGNVEGVGLGLYLARRIAELHGGALDVTSKLGKGTKFVMILPQGDNHASTNPGN